MKKIYQTTLLVALFSSSLQAQTKGDIFADDYASNQGWAQINTGVSIADGVAKAKQATAYQTPRRVYKQLPVSLKSTDNWRLETDFMDETGTSEYSVYDYLSLTVDNYDPHVTCNTLSDGCSATPNSNLNILLRAGKVANGNIVHTYIMINNVGTSLPVDLTSNVQYYVTLEKVDSVFTLSLFTDAKRQVLATGFPTKFVCKPALPELKYIQHGVSTAGGNFRVSSFTVDNTFITRLPNLVTSIADEIVQTNTIKVYPNPTVSGVVTIQSNYIEPQKAELYNELGVLVQNTTFFVGSNTVTLADYPKGIYFLKTPNQILRIVKE